MIILTANCVRHSGQEDHQTGILTQELIDGYGLLPQQILCEAIAFNRALSLLPSNLQLFQKADHLV
ncbi:hypothetical protein [Nostoc sp. ChiQUE01b]|uniref:hypothetical protein n=1 Tax=Nostoc sp. ChiQUE01b TaxID=3075376 RepID=UPI002AD2F767|nr:hypothetical protein [Nostoc sp. ChiQUE01b]MDZ8263956.1 hypothetical protein [Nostoc sp. ChiQUE01b]